MPMRDEAGTGFELAQQFWADFEIELGREEEHHHRRLIHVRLEEVLVQKADMIGGTRCAGVLLAFGDALGIDVDADAARAPNCRTAVITMRPSPHPRSYTTSSALTLASRNMTSTTSGGVGS